MESTFPPMIRLIRHYYGGCTLHLLVAVDFGVPDKVSVDICHVVLCCVLNCATHAGRVWLICVPSFASRWSCVFAAVFFSALSCCGGRCCCCCGTLSLAEHKVGPSS
mgnify:CR=1 FL=1